MYCVLMYCVSGPKLFSFAYNWVGHLIRLHEDTPAKQALVEAKYNIAKCGGKKYTWLKQIQNDLKNKTLDIAEQLTWCAAYERDGWRNEVKRMMSNDI